MPRIPRHRRRRRLILLGGAALSAASLLAIWMFTTPLRLDDATGTMGSSSALALSPIAAEWEGAANDRVGTLFTPFAATFSAFNPSREDRAADLSVYFSRDGSFDSADDCLVDDVSVTLPGGVTTNVEFHATSKMVPCLDAGPWKVGILDRETETWTEVDGTFDLQGADANLSLSKLPVEVGRTGSIDLQLLVSREAGSFGVPGLWEHESDVWLRNGDDLCLIETDPITLKRNPVAHAAGTWTNDVVEMPVQLASARQVRSLGDYPDPFRDDSPRSVRDCEGCQPPLLGDACNLSEGNWRVAVGPSAPGFRETKEVFIHAPPVSIDVEPIEITLGEGGVGHAELEARTFSRRDIRWSSEPADPINQDWLVGMSDQRFRGRRTKTLSFTISAADLGPGRYSGEFLVTVDDFYGTEVRVPVELTVVASRAGAADPFEVQDFAVSNYPNPFQSRTTIQLDVEREGQFTLAVYDIQGREVAVLLDDWLPQGRRNVQFEADGLASGTYLYRLSGAGSATTGTMSLIK